MIKPVADDSYKSFKQLGLDKFENLALVSVSIGGVSCDAVSVIYQDEEGNAIINPVAIFVNDDLFKIIEGPDSEH